MKISKELYDHLCTLKAAELDDQGRELLNPMQLEIPYGMERPASLQEQIQRVLRNELSMQAHNQGQETFEEANDFDVLDDDPEPFSAYEMRNMIPEEPSTDVDTPTLKDDSQPDLESGNSDAVDSGAAATDDQPSP